MYIIEVVFIYFVWAMNLELATVQLPEEHLMSQSSCKVKLLQFE